MIEESQKYLGVCSLSDDYGKTIFGTFAIAVLLWNVSDFISLAVYGFQQYELFQDEGQQESGIAFTVPRDMADGYINNKREVYQFRWVFMT